MPYRLTEHKHAHPNPIPTDHEQRFVYRYHVTFTSIIAALPAAAAAVQEGMFWDGAVTAASFFLIDKEPAPGPTRGLWLWHAVFERPDCESDYHTCYADDSMNDGSDAQAIQQLQGEIDEALAHNDAGDPLIHNVTVRSRAAIPTDQPMVAWGESTRELLLQKVNA